MQFSIIYCEKRESTSKSDSFLFYGIKYSNTGSLLKDIKKEQGVFNDINELRSVIDNDTLVVTLNSFDILEKYNIKSYKLTSLLNLPQQSSLYDIFSYYFDSGDEVLTNTCLISSILVYLLTQCVNIQYTYCVYYCRNSTYSFCWFYITTDSKVTILGDTAFTVERSSCSDFLIGKFKKQLRFNLITSGACCSQVRYLSLDTFIQEIDCLNGLTYEKALHILSTNLVINLKYTAKEFILALSQSSGVLNLHSLSDGTIESVSSFSKDYSICDCTTIDKTRGAWGIILDCEGNKNNNTGLRELGGIIFCRYNNILLSVQTFQCSEVLLEETLQQVIRDYEVNLGRYIPSRGIDVITFGGTDEVMIEASLHTVSSKQFRRKIKRLFRYHDCRDFIYDYITDSKITVNGRKSLSNIAVALDVPIIRPKHSALADSRTLFNILAFILQDINLWFLDVNK